VEKVYRTSLDYHVTFSSLYNCIPESPKSCIHLLAVTRGTRSASKTCIHLLAVTRGTLNMYSSACCYSWYIKHVFICLLLLVVQDQLLFADQTSNLTFVLPFPPLFL